MMRKFIAMFATVAFAMATFSTAPANAQRYRDRGGDYHNSRGYDGYDRGRRGGYDRSYYNRPECYDRQGRNHCYDRRDDNDDAVAAGVIGLVLGAVLATAVANGGNNSQRNDGYYSRQDDGYYRGDDGYYRGNDGYYDAPRCTQQVRRWDRTQDRYVLVEVPC